MTASPSSYPRPVNIAALNGNWLVKAHALVAFVADNGRLPRQSGVDEPVERSLGRWLQTQIRVAAGKRDSADAVRERAAWLDKHVPGWNVKNARPAGQKMKTQRTFDAKMHALRRFVERHDRLPVLNGPEKNETWLAKFLDNCRQPNAFPKLTAVQEARIDKAAPGWRTPAGQLAKTTPESLRLAA